MSLGPIASSPARLATGRTMSHLARVGLVLVAASGRRMVGRATPEARHGFALAC